MEDVNTGCHITGYISRDEAISALANNSVVVKGMRFGKLVFAEYTKKVRDGCIDILKDVPDANVVEKRFGEWIEVGKTDKGTPIRMCSNCGIQKAGRPKSKYCPDCGAFMPRPNIFSKMEDISNCMALSAKSASTASRAIYQLSQAMGSGIMCKEDYKSIQNTSMDTE